MMEEKKEAQVQENLARIKHRIIVMSGKGGVGKSTIAVNLAYGLALEGKNVGLLDADIHGPSVAKMTGSEGARASGTPEGMIQPVRLHDNFHALSIAHLSENSDAALIWRGPMKMSALKEMIQNTAWGDLDYLIVDCPPGTGDEPLSVVQLLGSLDGAVIVSSAQDVAVLDVRKSLDFASKLNLPILGLIENMSYVLCPHCGKEVPLFSGEGVARALMDYDTQLLAKLPFDTNITASCDSGRPFIYDFGKTESAIALQDSVKAIIARLETSVD